MALKIFGFRALWSPYFLVFTALVLIAYFLITVKYRKKFPQSEPLTKLQGFNFTFGILLLYIIKGSPIDLMGHLMFYAHMIQMAFLCLVIPQFIIVGIPQWIWRALLKKSSIKAVFNLFTNPIVALLLFNGVFSVYHLPIIFDLVKTNIWSHAIYTSVLFILAIFFWWPLLNPLKDEKGLNGLKKIAYIFAGSALLLPACGLLIFTDRPVYATYSDPELWAKSLELCVPQSTLAGLTLSGPEMFSPFTLAADQQFGGIVMKIIQEIVYAIVLAKAFFEWYRKEQELEPDMNERLNPQPIE